LVLLRVSPLSGRAFLLKSCCPSPLPRPCLVPSMRIPRPLHPACAPPAPRHVCKSSPPAQVSHNGGMDSERRRGGGGKERRDGEGCGWRAGWAGSRRVAEQRLAPRDSGQCGHGTGRPFRWVRLRVAHPSRRLSTLTPGRLACPHAALDAAVLEVLRSRAGQGPSCRLVSEAPGGPAQGRRDCPTGPCCPASALCRLTTSFYGFTHLLGPKHGRLVCPAGCRCSHRTIACCYPPP
jgi:hypothetical protein